MDEFERQIGDALRDAGQDSTGRHSARKKEVIGMAEGIYDRSVSTAKAWTWGIVAVETAAFVTAVIFAFILPDLKLTVVLMGLAVAAYATTILMKLWFWIVHTRITLQEEIKELQLQIAELSQKLDEDE